jgi:hypothetical protein
VNGGVGVGEGDVLVDAAGRDVALAAGLGAAVPGAVADVIRAQPGEGAFDRRTDVGRAAVEDARPATGVRDHAEPGGQHHLVAAALDRPADEFLIGEGPVDLGRVKEGDAQIERPVNGTDGLGVVRARSGVAEHPHGAQTDAGDVHSR